LRDSLRALDVVVLNGDIFDFRWSTLSDLKATRAAAFCWLLGLADDLPACEIHFVMGNHDCHADFEGTLTLLETQLPNFHWHDTWLQLGSALFVHGDCAHATMDAAGFNGYRSVWRHDRQRGALAAAAYGCADRLGATRLAHAWHFPRERTLRRVAHYLDEALPYWRATTRDCYFGHTHLPFARHEHEGVVYHNTGSAIRGMPFRPAFFTTESNYLTNIYDP